MIISNVECQVKIIARQVHFVFWYRGPGLVILPINNCKGKHIKMLGKGRHEELPVQPHIKYMAHQHSRTWSPTKL